MEILSQNADIILTGKVVEQKSFWNKDKTRINTNAVVQAEEYLKGDYSEKTLIVTTLGGEIDDVGELYSHMPRFTNDEEVLLFVKKDKKDMKYKILNGEDGKLTLYRDKSGELMTSFNKKISALKNEIKNYVEK
jgi:agmatine/peptidylarginine deiminase